nr:MAG TPA: hypothetical protein [Caudoviricetes sp.]
MDKVLTGFRPVKVLGAPVVPRFADLLRCGGIAQRAFNCSFHFRTPFTF